jgi:hypothetical protein
MPENAQPEAGAVRTRRRAEAWVHGVLNPLIDTLPAEIALLERGNITFNCDTGQLRHVRRTEETLTTPARHVLRDFVRANADAEKPLGLRDAAVDRLAEAARKSYDSVVKSDAFRKDVISLAKSSSRPASASVGGFAPSPAVEIDPEQLVRAFGEFVVNNRRGQMTDFESGFASVWNPSRERLLAYRSSDAFAQSDAALRELLEADARLLQWLQDKSFAVCEQFDVAAAPIGEFR